MSAADRFTDLTTAAFIVGLAVVITYLLVKADDWISARRDHGRNCLCERHVHERAMEALGDITQDKWKVRL